MDKDFILSEIRRCAAANDGVTVEVGVGADAARQDHAGHIRRMTDGRPHVILKLAVSGDGKAGLSGRRPVQITGSAARNQVHQMRATSDAVLTGIGTALSDDPLLTCRLPGMAERSPVRVVLDSRLRLPLEGRLVAVDHGQIPPGAGQLVFTLTCLQSADRGQLAAPQWMLLRRERTLQVNGIPVLPVARVRLAATVSSPSPPSSRNRNRPSASTA